MLLIFFAKVSCCHSEWLGFLNIVDFGFLNSGAQPLEVDSSVTLAISNGHPRLVVQLCSIGLSQPHSLNVILAHLLHWPSNRNNSNERNSLL